MLYWKAMKKGGNKMNWMQSLYETYEQCVPTYLGYASGAKRPLLPICHVTVQAHIEVVIDGNGNFRRAQLVPKDDAVTIIPATEVSASRSGSKPECHPLCDKLQYLAGDFEQYGGVVTSGFQNDPSEPYRNFVGLLSGWCACRPHPKICAVLKYVRKGTVMADLVRSEILLVDKNQKLLDKGSVDRDKRSRTIFDLIDDQSEAVVRWIVETPGDKESRVWHDESLWDSWIDYYLKYLVDESRIDVCFVTGEERLLTGNHPKYIRREGDNAKLISSNDKRGFTFRGRFTTDAEACSVSLEASHKAHYALAWLINRQGYKEGDLAIVAWAVSGAEVPQPTDDPITALYGDLPSDDKHVDTAQDVAIRLKKKIAGYRQNIGDRTDVVVMAIDSATTGRMAVIYYRALKGSDFLDRIEDWHETCAWRHEYRTVEEPDENGKKRKRTIPFIGAPAPADIAEAAYGSRLDDELKKATIKRLLPCIVDSQPLPRDLVESVIRRASNPAGLSRDQWMKVLTIACALYRKYRHGKEHYDMALDEKRTTRDYLYGRLLAIADFIEERALHKAEQNRSTNAIRYMHQFSQRPFRTWKQLHDLLTPYLARLGSSAYYYKNLIAEVQDMFLPEDFMSTKPLSGEYLLGFYSQRQKLREKRSDAAAEGSSDEGASN